MVVQGEITWPILEYGTEEQKQRYLIPLAKGKKLGAFGLTEPNAGTDAASQHTTARLEGDDYVINGSKVFITNGASADIFIIFAMTDKSKGVKGISAFIVDKETPGFSIAMSTLDGGRIGISAQALGIAQGALDETIKYVNQREQFGKPIAKFQGLQWYIAEMATKVQAARWLVYNAAFKKDNNQPYSMEAAMAKLNASETAMEVDTRSEPG